METKLKELLAERQRKIINSPGYIRSAVLVPICEENGESYIVFIKRTNRVKVHKGQVSFPGGGVDGNDKSLLDTALREAKEEIGLLPEDAEVLGCLDDTVASTSNYVLTPYVARIPCPYSFTREEFEVDEVFRVPVAALMDNTVFSKDTHLPDGRVLTECSYTYEGRLIWGATARILTQLLEIIREAGRAR